MRLRVDYRDGHCVTEIDGRPLIIDPDRTDFRRWRRKNVHLDFNRDLPYRCIGGMIFALQRAGVGRIGFISEPPDTDDPVTSVQQ